MSDEVRNMFSEISDKYDFMNNLLSFGIHHKWRKKAVRLSGIREGLSVLDCACGTGDLSFEFKRKAGKSGKVIGTDFVENMVKIAQLKAESNGLDVSFEVDDATNLNKPDNTFDISSISFGIRNVDSVTKCLQEMARVVKPSGKVVIIEFGQPRGIFGLLFKLYSFILMPILGRIFARNSAAYQYLPATSAKFPCREDFIKIMDESHSFSSAEYHTLTFGIAFIYLGTVK